MCDALPGANRALLDPVASPVSSLVVSQGLAEDVDVVAIHECLQSGHLARAEIHFASFLEK